MKDPVVGNTVLVYPSNCNGIRPAMVTNVFEDGTLNVVYFDCDKDPAARPMRYLQAGDATRLKPDQEWAWPQGA